MYKEECHSDVITWVKLVETGRRTGRKVRCASSKRLPSASTVDWAWSSSTSCRSYRPWGSPSCSPVPILTCFRCVFIDSSYGAYIIRMKSCCAAWRGGGQEVSRLGDCCEPRRPDDLVADRRLAGQPIQLGAMAVHGHRLPQSNRLRNVRLPRGLPAAETLLDDPRPVCRRNRCRLTKIIQSTHIKILTDTRQDRWLCASLTSRKRQQQLRGQRLYRSTLSLPPLVSLLAQVI